MKKISSAKKAKITNQWCEQFPDMRRYKSMWLLRCIGPLLHGICLDRDSSNENYSPTFHVHNLVGQEDDFISLSLKTVLTNSNGSPLRITERHHDTDYLSIIEMFKKQSPFGFAGDITLKSIVKSYDREISSGRADVKYPLSQWYDLVCLYIWCGKEKEARNTYEKCEKKIAKWPKEVTSYIEDRIEKFTRLNDYLDDPIKLKNEVESSLVDLKLEDISRADVI
jgi:hypothetical protein